MTLPDCMMPDGADPCRGYHELRAENEQLKAYAKHERSLGAEGPMIELVSARQEIERLKAESDISDGLLADAKAQIERLEIALGPSATEAWAYMFDEIERLSNRLLADTKADNERLQAAIAYVRNRSQRACEILNEFDNTRTS